MKQINQILETYNWKYPADLCRLSDVVKIEVVKKTEFNKLDIKVNNVNITEASNLVKKTDYDTKIY